jgi:hypothetical protein
MDFRLSPDKSKPFAAIAQPFQSVGCGTLPTPCHSEAGFIGEESASASSETADFSRHKAALRNDNPLGISNCTTARTRFVSYS